MRCAISQEGHIYKLHFSCIRFICTEFQIITIAQARIYMKKVGIVLLFLVTLALLIGCEDQPNNQPNTELTVMNITKDTITIIFPTGYKSFNLPNEVTMTDGKKYKVDVYLVDENPNTFVTPFHYQLVGQQEGVSVTLKMIGDGADLVHDRFNVKLYTGLNYEPTIWKKTADFSFLP